MPTDLGDDNVDRTIAGGPLYSSECVTALVENDGSNLRTWTKKCLLDMQQKLGIDNDGAAELISETVRQGRYLTSEWCRGTYAVHWAACDAYSLTRKEWNNYAHKELTVEYYLKFAISKSGEVLLLVSCHNPEDRS